MGGGGDRETTGLELLHQVSHYKWLPKYHRIMYTIHCVLYITAGILQYAVNGYLKGTADLYITHLGPEHYIKLYVIEVRALRPAVCYGCLNIRAGCTL